MGLPDCPGQEEATVVTLAVLYGTLGRAWKYHKEG